MSNMQPSDRPPTNAAQGGTGSPSVPGEASTHSPFVSSEACGALLTSIITGSDDAIVAHALDGRISVWSPGARHLFGYAPEEIVGRPIDLLLPPERLEQDHQLVDRVIQASRPECFEAPRLAKDGRRIDVALTLSPIHDAAGAVVGVCQILRDIGERKRTEQARWDSAAQLEGVVNTAVDGIIAIDERGTMEWLNPAALRIFGYSSQELVGQNIRMLMPEPYHSQHDQYLANYRQTGKAKIIGIGREVQGLRKDGKIFPVDLAVSEVHLGHRRMFTGIVRDITLRKEVERSMIEAKEAAEAASKAKDQFLAMVSHELRTPLNPILAAVTFLESTSDLPADVKEEIVSIRRNVEHEAQIVDDLLNLTRLARGKLQLHQEAVDAHALIRMLLGHSEREMRAKNITLQSRLDAPQTFVWADPQRIRQVLTNLIDNAIKFTPGGGVITVTTAAAKDDKIRIDISDTGIGMAPDALDRIFSPFEQGEHAITRRFGGLGLGLAISKGIVDLHGGSLTARSAGRGLGATFSLELRNVPAVPLALESQHKVLARGQGQRVLLVEDHQDTLRVMAKLLRALGYTVITAESVHEAVALADAEPFDILLSDIGLPDGSGLDVLRYVRDKHMTMKAVALSGFGQPDDLSRSRAAGFMDHLVKPVNFQKLEAVLRRLSHN